MKIKNLLLSTVAIIALSGCGSESSTEQAPETGVTLTGVAVDGYLSGSTVCLDLNADSECNNGEPSTTTDSNGKYSLSYNFTSDKERADANIIVFGGRDIDTGEAFEGQLSSSIEGNNEINITPITTAVVALKVNGRSLIQAKRAVAKMFRISENDLGVDPTISAREGRAEKLIIALELQKAVEMIVAVEGADLDKRAKRTLTRETYKKLLSNADENTNGIQDLLDSAYKSGDITHSQKESSKILAKSVRDEIEKSANDNDGKVTGREMRRISKTIHSTTSTLSGQITLDSEESKEQIQTKVDTANAEAEEELAQEEADNIAQEIADVEAIAQAQADAKAKAKAKADRLAEEAAQAEADAKAKADRLAEEAAQAQAQAHANTQAKAKADRLAEEAAQAKIVAEAKAQARREADRLAEEAAQAKIVAEVTAKKELERQQKLQKEADEKARVAEEKAAEARAEAARVQAKQAEDARLAQIQREKEEEQERQDRIAEADRLAKAEQDRKDAAAKAEADRLAKAEQDAKNNTPQSNKIIVTSTGQTKSYRSGDDGAKQNGANSVLTRDDSTNIVTDTMTGLMWEDKIYQNTSDGSWNAWTPTDGTPSTQQHCNALNMGGYSDWRVPTKDEILTIMDFSGTNVGSRRYNKGGTMVTEEFMKFIDPIFKVLPRFSGSDYYLAESVVENSEKDNRHYTADFLDGTIKSNSSEGRKKQTKCVRSDTKFPTQPHIVKGNQVATDLDTNLMWEDTGWAITSSDKRTSWNEAIDKCNNLTLAGHSDWRLPNVKEMLSLMEYKERDSSPVKMGVATRPYCRGGNWTSTTIPFKENGAYWVSMAYGFSSVSITDKTKAGFGRCVRDTN